MRWSPFANGSKAICWQRAQEVEKLALQNLAQPITQEVLLSCLEDTSRFNSFDLIDAAMAGQGERGE